MYLACKVEKNHVQEIQIEARIRTGMTDFIAGTKLMITDCDQDFVLYQNMTSKKQKPSKTQENIRN